MHEPVRSYRRSSPICLSLLCAVVLGTPTPPPEVAERLHFNVSPTDDGWNVLVWQFGHGEVAPPGAFTTVSVGRDFAVKRVIGGA